MKFRVLQGMMDKTMNRAASTGVVEDGTREKMDTLSKELRSTMEELQSRARA
jgi:hypothetical protein